MKKEFSILFIGNSYTFYNKMPQEIFLPMAQKAGISLSVDTITRGGHKLYEFCDPEDDYGKLVPPALSEHGKYDFVILQEQSVLPASENVPRFYSAVRTLCEKVRSAGAVPILYATWGRKSGSKTLTERQWTSEGMTYRLAAAYQAIGEELDLSVAHAGLAFFHVANRHPEMELYREDKSHPSYEGSFLAAATLFATVFRKDPTQVPFFGALDETTASRLLSAAKEKALCPPLIPEEYRTSSLGIR